MEHRLTRTWQNTLFIALALLSTASTVTAGGSPSPNTGARMTKDPLNSQLLQAATTGNATQVVALLKAGADPNATDASGRTALTWAAMNNHVAAARALVNAGANPDTQDVNRNNALLVTGETGNVDMLREILKAKPDLTRTNRFGGTALIPAADRGHLDYVREILTTTNINVNHVNNLGWTALLEAVILGDGGTTHTEIVRLLLTHGADRNIPDKQGITALQHAQERGYSEMVKLLSNTK